MARKPSVAVGHGLCVGNAMCTTIAAKAFTLNDDRQAIPADVDADSAELVIDAADNCPVAAILVAAADSGGFSRKTAPSTLRVEQTFPVREGNQNTGGRRNVESQRLVRIIGTIVYRGYAKGVGVFNLVPKVPPVDNALDGSRAIGKTVGRFAIGIVFR